MLQNKISVDKINVKYVSVLYRIEEIITITIYTIWLLHIIRNICMYKYLFWNFVWNSQYIKIYKFMNSIYPPSYLCLPYASITWNKIHWAYCEINVFWVFYMYDLKAFSPSIQSWCFICWTTCVSWKKLNKYGWVKTFWNLNSQNFGSIKTNQIVNLT